jgi:RNA polymerase sigma-70 factor (ECF subfamily)
MGPEAIRRGAAAPAIARLSAAEAADDDAQLAAAARADPDAFVALYRRYVGAIHRYLLGQVGDRGDAEDLTATTFRKALTALDGYDERGTFAAWLFGIARHTLRDYQRRRRPVADVVPLAADLPDPDPLPEERALAAERARTLHRLLGELPPAQREALALHYFGGLRAAEIAAIQGCGHGALRMRLHRGLAALRARYRTEGES